MIISLLVAADEDNVIGKDNQLPWHLPNDLKYFKNHTWAMPVLMGRKTFESIGKPLPGRKSIVITRNKDWNFQSVDVVHSLDAALKKAADYGAKEIFVIGGAEIFKSAFSIANRIYLTRIHYRFNGDVHLSGMIKEEWELKSNKYCEADEKNPYPHSFQVWERV